MIKLQVPFVIVATAAGCAVHAPGTVNFTGPDGPISIAAWLDQAKTGDTLYLTDGVYRGPAGVIYAKGKQGLTIAALNEGAVLIDGEGQRVPVALDGCDHVEVVGVNACRSSGSVVQVNGSTDCAVRRACAWDAAIDRNAFVFSDYDSTDTIFEDCAGWGTARKIFQTYKCKGTMFVRCYARWQGSINVGPKMAFSMHYESSGASALNCIGTWDASRMPESYTLMNNGQPYNNPPQTLTAVQDPWGIIGMDNATSQEAVDVDVHVTGCVAYLLPGQRCDALGGGALRFDRGSNITVANSLAVVRGHDNIRTALLYDSPIIGITVRQTQLAIINTVLAGPAPSIRGWTQTNVTTLDAAGCSSGVCIELPAGILPWPMEHRINAAAGVSVEAELREATE